MTLLSQYLADALDRLERHHQTRSLVATRMSGPARLERQGHDLIDFSSNDYLGLARHPLLAERSAEWAIRHGSGSGASRLVTGTSPEHLAIEARIARFKGTEAALLFPTGWQLNAAVLAALLKAAPGTLLFTDRLVHGRVHAGAAGHRQIRFRDGPRLIVTESVFSMDGDRADVERLVRIAQAHDAFLYLDEAHATGVLGPDGAGLSRGITGKVDLVMGTFSKAMGCFGAYVAGSRLLIDYLVNACGGFIFSTAPPPAMLGAIDAALDLVPGMEAERQRLADHAVYLRARLAEHGIDTGASSTQIIPVIVGEAERAVTLSATLAAEGLLASAIRPPTVPQGTSRLRIVLRASHTREDVDQLLHALVRQLR
ncbi:MAG: 8-amino-7-oxononanoate synthase [Sphingomonas sp.]|nr:8-amino-7-oxononanoate synthase [Sphingomonas sp.]